MSSLPLFLLSPPSSAHCMFIPTPSNILNPQACILLSLWSASLLQFLDTSSTSVTDSLLLLTVFINVNWTGLRNYLSPFLYPLNWKKKKNKHFHTPHTLQSSVKVCSFYNLSYNFLVRSVLHALIYESFDRVPLEDTLLQHTVTDLFDLRYFTQPMINCSLITSIFWEGCMK